MAASLVQSALHPHPSALNAGAAFLPCPAAWSKRAQLQGCGILQARILEWVAVLQGIFLDPGIELQSPALQADSLPSELPGEP